MQFTTDVQAMTKVGMERLLDQMEGPGPGRVTLYLPPASLPAIRTLLAGTDPELADEVVRKADDTWSGAAVFLSASEAYIVAPPFPIRAENRSDGWNGAPLRALLARRYLLGVVLLRLGAYAVGVLDGDELVASKADTRYVKGKHHAGGWSQQRFARIREKQMRELFDEACEVARSRMAPYERRLDYIFLGGERLTLLAFRKRCPYLEKLAGKIAPRILDVERPNRGALEGIPREVWKCRVTLVRRA